MEIRATTVSEALPLLAQAVMAGDEVGSRGGRVMEILHPHVVLTEPWRREVLTPGRRANVAAQIAETMWVLAGRNDVEWLGRYLPRAKDFSDDGEVWRGGYGPRLRSAYGIDQLAHVVDLLRADPLSRRAVIAIYDPTIDTESGKDIPCNDFLTFQSRLGLLHMSVTIRSNDLIWGWSGINAFEWSALQEIIAGLLGIGVGELHFSISSLHVYDRHWGRAGKLADADVFFSGVDSPRFKMFGMTDVEGLDGLVQAWFQLEEQIRSGEGDDHTHDLVDSFPEPMMRSWLRVIEWWWSGDDMFLEPLKGTALEAAARLSPIPEVNAHGFPGDPAPWASVADAQYPDPFLDFVSGLHADKHAVYGDSWKRRGEQIGILANIARKVDRLGEAGAGDTSADTAIDLLVYLCKYRLWLTDERGERMPPGFDDWPTVLLGDGPPAVDHLLRTLPDDSAPEPAMLIKYLKDCFEALSEAVVVNLSRNPLVEGMMVAAVRLARRLWLDEQQSEGRRIEAWQAGNAKRVWRGYDA